MPEDRPDPADLSARDPAIAGQGADNSAEEHDDTGLDLARSIARGLAGARRTTKRRPLRRGTRPRRTDPQASGAYPDDRDPQLLDSTIGRLIAEQGWGTDVRVHGVFSRWEHLVGADVAQHCTPESFTPGGAGATDGGNGGTGAGADSADGAGGKLVVRTDSTAWATQMRLLAPTVLRRLNEELGQGTVTMIDVLGPSGPSWKRGLRSVRDGRGPRDTYG